MPSPKERLAILDAVYLRDGGCVAILVDPNAGPCRDRWGNERPRTMRAALTGDHVKEDPRLGVKAPFDIWHLVMVCHGHSEDGAKAGYQWNTAHRPELRKYLAKFAADAAASPSP